MSSLARFPFSAVVGQSEARLALLLAAVDPGIGGVLLRGDKGSAKSTLARGLAGMLPGGAPFVELPLGATEDRVLGTLDVQAGGSDGDAPFRPGLLARANGGVLYVDEVNLLPDHLVDMLLDVAESGLNRVERDGLSHSHPARFVLVGSMNPEEGELRPQLLDRFGLSVEIKAPTDPLERAEVVRRRLTHDSGGRVGGAEGDIVLRARLAAAMPADLPDTVVDFACRLAVGVGAEGLRADLVLCRAAAAFAGWEGRSVARSSDVERVAPLALGHRRRRRPFDPPVLSTPDLERALASARQSFADAYPQPEPAAPPSPPPTAADAAAAFDAAVPGGNGGSAGAPANAPADAAPAGFASRPDADRPGGGIPSFGEGVSGEEVYAEESTARAGDTVAGFAPFAVSGDPDAATEADTRTPAWPAPVPPGARTNLGPDRGGQVDQGIAPAGARTTADQGPTTAAPVDPDRLEQDDTTPDHVRHAVGQGTEPDRAPSLDAWRPDAGEDAARPAEDDSTQAADTSGTGGFDADVTLSPVRSGHGEGEDAGSARNAGIAGDADDAGGADDAGNADQAARDVPGQDSLGSGGAGEHDDGGTDSAPVSSAVGRGAFASPPEGVAPAPGVADGAGGMGSAPSSPPGGPWRSLSGGTFNAPPASFGEAPPPSFDPGPVPHDNLSAPVRTVEPHGLGEAHTATGIAAGIVLADAAGRAAAQWRQDGVDVAAAAATAGASGPAADATQARTVGRTVVVAVDASGSTGTHKRVEAATGAVLGLLGDAYLRRDQVAMVTFRGDTAEVVLSPTASLELARTRLAELPTGGVTPLAEGIDAGLDLARRAESDGSPPLLVLVSDGGATGDQSAPERAAAVAAEVAAAEIDALVIDAGGGSGGSDQADELAGVMGARCVRLDDLTPAAVEEAVRDALR